MKTIGLARMGRDAEVRNLPSGESVANLSLAVSYYSKGAENNRATQWIDATLWGKQAESLARHLVKGSVHCFALSDIHMETYTGKNGEAQKLVARCDSVDLGPRSEGGQSVHAEPQRQAPAPRQAATKPAASGFDDMDDIPF